MRYFTDITEPAKMGHESRLMPDTFHKVFMVSNTLIYMLCKPVLRVLAGNTSIYSTSIIAKGKGRCLSGLLSFV